MGKRLTTEEFISKAREVHGDRYDYSKVEYKNAKTKVKIICPIHGVFEQSPDAHLHGQGCQDCGYDSNKLNQESFIEKAKEKHNDFYDYSKVDFKDKNDKVCIICPRHGEFWQTPYIHLKKHGCTKCGIIDFRRKTLYGVGVNDVDEYSVKDRGYKIWASMLQRACSNAFKYKHESYMECSVCDEWKYYSNFLAWYKEKEPWIHKGWHLDKDILANGRKIYSPQTCCFVPHDINIIFTQHKREKGVEGISFYEPTGKYYVNYRNKEKKIMGAWAFDSKEEAIKAYKEAKEAHIRKQANKYKDKLEPRVYEALINYKVEIED